ncbi:MAG: hypothetical protein PHI38_06285 [Sulfurimonas sp.]|uniref:hypothetical protein n=1 Tax=Sulfurimonas sp. TaxID=2022749 RepID=UPI00260CF3E9|nr:hypothetical protein [Sulfurimonas sp.]MDD3476458.1 hypothetical protein [Sulfurimonas sp.]
MLSQHDADGGNEINESLGKLFSSLSDEENKNEVSIKVAALNQLYSTAIQYIKPVVAKIVSEVKQNHSELDDDAYLNLVDRIACIEWVSETTGKHHKRKNLSLASKYVHFLSKRYTPIYDSYIWLVMVAYLKEKNIKINLSSPESYSEFYRCFSKFKESYCLESYSNYQIDKFLWQYGKNILSEIIRSEGVNLDKAKSIFKKRITRRSSRDALTRTA